MCFNNINNRTQQRYWSVSNQHVRVAKHLAIDLALDPFFISSPEVRRAI